MSVTPKKPRASRPKPSQIVLGGRQASLEEIERAMVDTLQPRSALERRRAKEIAMLEVETVQHRRMRDSRLLAAARDIAAGYLTTGRFVPSSDAAPKDQNIAHDLIGEDQARREAAEDKLLAAGTTLDELLARAYHTMSEALAHHETRIASLEKRRRELLDDYEMLRVIAPRMRSHG